ncbi:FAD binding domain-containing protein [Amycolatopsis acidiphila]|uniref:Molybdopterin dehydrogenase n=1 Tax=Amycolatopsis acidiphila TaxID=715473 RepID=A0A558A210_9PSEU|nr:FAD binding domain-containing protein [Amycolatopsis acidiphila]TVT18290.1 molybdopterin dehydrogenase [Amycolatopsis acidiphila]UIJ57945.1 FAD binding domain-containing protein [Amycolatopsis acidiphila]GHG70977.1 carbon monoxide dehydrogenase [Amycolatopsis acidiphila]
MPAYHYPDTLDEACTILASGEDAMVYGGGTAVQILVKQGVLFASDLVDIGRIPGLGEIERTSAGLRVGPLVTLRQMETSPLVREVAPLAAEVYGHVANPRVRNTASVGGNIAHGDYRLDPPTALLVLAATVELTSSRGKRSVPVREFFVDFQKTAVEPGEVITAIEIPRQPESAGAHFAKYSSLSANDWPAASAAALIVDGSRNRRQVRLGLGALSHIPLFTQFEVAADSPVEDVVSAAKEAATPLIDPIPDVRGGSEYKKRLGLVAVEEAVRFSWKEGHDGGRTPFWRRRR